MNVNPSWTLGNSTAMPVFSTAATSPFDFLPIHQPARDQTCRDADRAADEQIAMLIADLKRPCPKCGHVKPPNEGDRP